MIIAELRTRLKSLNYCPIICLSALKGTGLNSLIASLNKVLKNAKKKLTKKEISEAIDKMITASPPSYQKGNKLKIYFAKQEPGILQHFIFFVNNPRWVHFSYQRYIVNYFRKIFGFEYLPIKIT
jgi:GTP-binding protein